MTKSIRGSAAKSVCAAGLLAVWAHAPQLSAAEVSDDGVLHIPTFELPMSQYMSAESKRSLLHRARNPYPAVASVDLETIGEVRANYDKNLYARQIARARALYAVDISEQRIGGVVTDVVVPKAGISVGNKDRVLINLHGGGFIVGARLEGQIESIPIAALGRIKVITVDYRMGPEHKFPAASEDVASVYRDLLKQYDPQNIGVFGISAGGYLTAQAVAWFQDQKLPMPGAVGVFSAGVELTGDGGDSAYWAHVFAPVLEGASVPAPRSAKADPPPHPYFGAADLTDWRISPGLYPPVLAKFPPTLLVSGTRDWLLSRTVRAHRALVKAGVTAELHVWDGMWHGWNDEADLPEAQEYYDVTVKFFDRYLGDR